MLVGTAVGAALTTGLTSGLAAGGASAATAHRAGVTDVVLDVAGLSKFAALKYCATKSFAADPDSVRVLYGVRQLKTLTTTSRTFVLRNGSGKVLLCDLFGRDRPASLPLPTTTASKPAVFFTTGQRRWSCDGTTLRSFRMTNWLKVQDPVRSARVRYSVNGTPGRWFTAGRDGRFIHLQSWLGPTAGTDALKVELQLLDGSGSPVTVPGIPSGARKLDGCRGNVIVG
jgi:hypothetical protein